MNEHLAIPSQVQAMVQDINTTEVHLVELTIPDHPRLPTFNRSIRVYDIDVKAKQELIIFNYEQVLRDKETGEQVNIRLTCPEWIIYKETWSYLRGADNKSIEVPLLDNPTDKGKVKVPSYRYMVWLMKNNKSGLIQLIEAYLASFVDAKIVELNTL